MVREESNRLKASHAGLAFSAITQSLVQVSVLFCILCPRQFVLYRTFDAFLKKAKIKVEQRVQAAQFLHENGVLVHFEDPVSDLDELYILNAGWLCDMVARVRMLKLHVEQDQIQGVRFIMMKDKPR